MTLVNDDVCYW